MIADALLKVADSQVVTASAASNNVIDLGISGRDMFNGTQMSLLIAPQVAAVGTGTYSFQIQTSVDAAFTSPVAVGPAMTVPPSAMAGGRDPVILPFPYGTLLRYLRIFITTGGTSPGVTLSAYLQPTDLIQKSRDYAKAFSVQ